MLLSSTRRGSGPLGRAPAHEVRVRVRGGYDPQVIRSEAGVPLRLLFRREESSSCSEQVVFPAFGRSVTLPQGEQVAVDLLPDVPGEYEFTCGMGVLQGRLLVSPGRYPVHDVAPATAAEHAPVEWWLPADGGATRPNRARLGWQISKQLERQRKEGLFMSTTTATHTTVPTTARRFRRPKVNLTPQERLLRVLLGAFGAGVGAVLLTSAVGALAVVLEVLLVAAGADLVVTGALGHCPLYAKLGHVPRALGTHA